MFQKSQQSPRISFSLRQNSVDSDLSRQYNSLPQTLCGARKRERGMQVCWWLLQAWRKVGTEGGEDLMKGTAEEDEGEEESEVEGEGEADSLAPQLFGKTHRLLWKTQDVGRQGESGLRHPPTHTPSPITPHTHTHNSIALLTLSCLSFTSDSLSKGVLFLKNLVAVGFQHNPGL